MRTELMQAEALPLPIAESGAPEWLHLLPAGEIHTIDGRGPYPAADLHVLAERSMQAAGGRMPLDENHSTDLAAPKGGPSPARGWFVALQAREDGIWGQVEWTADGRALVEGKAYRHISPVITHGRDKRITGILRASLVNRPNMRGLAALHGEQSMDLLEKLRAQLGLDDEASGEDAVLAAIAGLQTTITTHAAELADLAKAAGAEGAEISVVLNAVQELADPAKFVPVEDVVALQQELAERAAELQTLAEAGKREKAEAAVDAAIAAGKAGVKPLRQRYIALHMADAAATQQQLEALPSLTGRSGATAEPPEKEKGGELSDAATRVIQLMGIDPEKFKATQAAIGVVEGTL